MGRGLEASVHVPENVTFVDFSLENYVTTCQEKVFGGEQILLNSTTL